MAKKQSPKINLEGLDDVSFNKEPDIKAAMSVIKEKTKVPKEEPENKEKPHIEKAKKTTKSNAKGTFPPPNKKRASFNIDEDLHRALRDYSYFNEVDMVDYVFNQLVRKDLSKKGYYPPKEKK